MEKNYFLIIDNREHNLIKLLTQAKINFEISCLDIGDIMICKKENDVNKPILLIERKSMADMVSSIKDGRYKEQKIRMCSAKQRGDIRDYIYILEGNIAGFKPQEIKLLWGSWISTQIRDNVKLIRTVNINETIHFIIRLFERIIRDGENKLLPLNIEKFDKNHNITTNEQYNKDTKLVEIGYLGTIKSKKKDNYNSIVCQILAISTIPGISNNMGESVIKEYGSLIGLVNEYNKITNNNTLNEDEKIKRKENLLSDIQITEKRKLGKKLSSKIYNHLFVNNL
jgi:ERCC4-type nuclease